jgi:hypothetical protein
MANRAWASRRWSKSPTDSARALEHADWLAWGRTSAVVVFRACLGRPVMCSKHSGKPWLSLGAGQVTRVPTYRRPIPN